MPRRSVLSAEKPNALAEPRCEEETLTKKGKKKKNVRWAEEEQLKQYFYFDLDETERGGHINMRYKSIIWCRTFSNIKAALGTICV